MRERERLRTKRRTVVTGKAHALLYEAISKLGRHRRTTEEAKLELLECLDALFRLLEHLVDVRDAEERLNLDLRLFEDAHDVAVCRCRVSGRLKERRRKERRKGNVRSGERQVRRREKPENLARVQSAPEAAVTVVVVERESRETGEVEVGRDVEARRLVRDVDWLGETGGAARMDDERGKGSLVGWVESDLVGLRRRVPRDRLGVVDGRLCKVHDLEVEGRLGKFLSFFGEGEVGGRGENVGGRGCLGEVRDGGRGVRR